MRTSLFGVQVAAVALAATWAFVFSHAMLFLINKMTAVRVSENGEEAGLDVAEHGETAYL